MRSLRWMVAASATIASVFALLALASPSSAQTTCRITGPASVAAGQRFTLCGPTGTGTTYEWYGPGLTSSGVSRCVDASGLAAGTYEFLLVRKSNDIEIDRCVHIVNVGGRSGGTTSCRISGPTSIQAGASATLCSPDDGIHAYRWTGPDGFESTAACITVSRGGTYYLTSRNPFTGSSRQCTHHLSVAGGGTDPTTGECAITGPEVVTDGGTARLCAPSRANTTYRWTGPGGFSATSRCITVSGTGTYSLTMRSQTTGRTERCTHLLSGSWQDDPNSDPDQPYAENCPRNFQFWRRALVSGTATGLSTADQQAIAREVDRRSTYFNWSNDLQGLRAALAPAAPLTRRKQVARQYAALLANMAAGELGVGDGLDNEGHIGLDADTNISFEGASTIGELAALTDRWLAQNRGNFAQLNSTLNRINRGLGIGTVCE
jgi:hypothetical protein